MNRIVIIIALISLLFFFGCIKTNEGTHFQSKQTHHEKDNEEITVNGIQTRSYANGTKAERVEYMNGRKNGEYTSWYENGQLKLICRFNEDIPDGEIAAWFEGGRKRFSVSFKDGKRHGKWIRYHEKRDSIVSEMSFKNDKLDGYLSTAFEQGNGNGTGRSFSIKSVFQDGILVDYFQYAYTDTKGHTIVINGELSENGNVKLEKQKNVSMTADGKLTIDYGQSRKTYNSIESFLIEEINRHVITKFSLDFCNSKENLWPCQFPKKRI